MNAVGSFASFDFHRDFRSPRGGEPVLLRRLNSPSLTVFAPAKINLFLAITGRRTDGFHDLVSVVAPLQYGDDLTVTTDESGAYSLSCDNVDVPVDRTNLVLRAAELFASETGWKSGARFFLRKRVPMGAGLGGGSSDGAAALNALNELSGKRLVAERLIQLAAQLGSDCPLFLQGSACVMRGRGERLESLPQAAAARLQGRRVLVFKPSFGIATVWAYREMAAQAPSSYCPAAEAEAKLAKWLNDDSARAEDLLYNSMETVAFQKYLALPTLLAQLRSQFGVAAVMSGSGSACFALLPETAAAEPLIAAIREAWGDAAFCVETRLR